MIFEEWLDFKGKIIREEEKFMNLQLYQDEIRFTICETTVIGFDIQGSVWVYYAGGTCVSKIKIAINRTPEQMFMIIKGLQTKEEK
ncbi:MAG: hypothetical protein J6T10_20340 [Methanobrevibacter sp.]|nr:hypothetical protein [Methanobrevibacter sp.]